MRYDEPTDVQRFCRDKLLDRIATINGQSSDDHMIDVRMDIDRACATDRITAPQARGLRTIYRRTVKAAIAARALRTVTP